jgi:PAS domain S-box-containing protein
MPTTRTRRILLLPIACLLLGTGISLLLSLRAGRDEAARLREDLHHASAPVAAVIQRVIDRHVEVVQSVAGLFYSSERVTPSEFREFTRGPLTSRHSIRALAWIPRVRHSQRDAFEHQARDQGVADFSIQDSSGTDRFRQALTREEYFPIAFVEPAQGNESAPGFDLGSDPLLRSALLEAMTTASSVATKSMRFVQGTGEELCFLLFHPVYRGHRDTTDEAERVTSLVGFAAGVFRVADLVADALGAAPSEQLLLRMRDITDPAQPLLLYISPGLESAPMETSGEGLEWTVSLSLPGRRWAVSFNPSGGHPLGHVHPVPYVWQVFGTGLLVTLLVAGSLFVVTRRSLKVEALAADLQQANRDLERENSERRKAETALRTSEERFLEMADHIEEVFWLFDWTNQRVIYASPAYEKLWGRSVADLYADYHEWGNSIHPDDREDAATSFVQVLDTGGGAPREYRIVRPDGVVRWILDRAFPVRDEAGEIVRVAGIAEDITDRKAHEEERRLLQAKMQHAQKLESLGVMAGGIAHDFNNLLMAVLGNADLALHNLAPDAPCRDYVEKIGKAAQRGAELTGQMLAYSGKGRFVVQAIQLSSLVDEMGNLLETVISKKTGLLFDLAPDLPPIEADASQIQQIIMNLITNASEALEETGGTVRVSTGIIDARRGYLTESFLGDELGEGRYVYLEVSDTGCGMTPETRRRIFDPFFTTKFTGRGLGLAAVLGIVKGHGGAIKVHSELSRGSSFKVLFPASTAVLQPVQAKPEAIRSNREGLTILLVDDDPGVLEVTSKILEHAGFRVLTAADGLQGLETFRQHGDEVALVLLDMTMPGMDGEEAFREMRRLRPEVQIILSSGYSELDATSRFAGKGLAGFIQKPYRSAKLLDRIYAALAG